MAAARPTFLADNNVGRLGRWLRALGYDAAYRPQLSDAALVAAAQAEDRVLLTRDLDLTHRRAIVSGLVRAILLRHDSTRDQLRQVARELGLGSDLALTRCLECNVALVPRERRELAGRVPPHVWGTQTRYSECPCCARAYWAGTHHQRMQAAFREILVDA